MAKGCDGRKGIQGHPCFGGNHRKNGRIHLAVAPHCNIKCGYCTRRHDCINESRPGVTSRILTPQQGLETVRTVMDNKELGSVIKEFVPVDAPGLLPALAARLIKVDGKPVFSLTDTVYLSQKDVRQVQLAKGAIRAGVEFLLRHTGVAAASLDKVLIAGSFGFHLTAQSLLTIGLLPQQVVGRIDFVGNTAKTGGEAFLLNRDSRREMEQLVSRVDVVELANCTDFDRVFVEFLAF